MGDEHRLLNPLNFFCMDCSYPLRGLASHECPECGRAFDPKDPCTYSPTASRWSLQIPYDAICAVIFVIPMAWVLIESLIGPGRHWWWRPGDINPILVSVFMLGLITIALSQYVSSRKLACTDSYGATAAAVGLIVFAKSGNVLAVYILALSMAFILVLTTRAWSRPAWWSRRLALTALFIGGFGWLTIILNVPIERSDIYNYWTYWFWTSQR